MITEQEIQYLKNKSLWSERDINLSLKFLQDNPDKKEAFIDFVNKYYKQYGDYCGDSWAIEACIKRGDAEAFYRFDSDVCESYINRFIAYFLKASVNEDLEFRNKRRRDEYAQDLLSIPMDEWTREEFDFLYEWGYIDDHDFSEIGFEDEDVDYHVDDLEVDDYIK